MCQNGIDYTSFDKKQQMMGQNIRKMSLSYAKCPHGDLHTGEVMNLVCFDAKCSKRGLICPICKVNNHDDHQVMPLKIFIDQVKRMFMQSEDTESLNNLSDYLRSIDETRKYLLGILRETAEAMAKEFKSVQEKIQENYLSTRKNILAQSTMSTKLPIFLQALLKKQENDPHWLQQQFKKYGELIKFQNSQIKISDKAQKIVTDYSQMKYSIQQVFNQQALLIKDGLKDLFSQKVKIVKKVQSNNSYVFSTVQKNAKINLSDDKKQASFPIQIMDEGIIYVQSPQNQQPSTQNKKITFGVVSVGSPGLYIGVGLPFLDQEVAYIFSGAVQNQHFLLTSTGYNDIKQGQQQIQQIPIDFQFHESGAEVTVQLDLTKNQVIFSQKKYEATKTHILQITNQFPEEQKSLLQFCVSLGQGDSVQIL